MTFVHWPCILQTLYNCLLILEVFCDSFWIFCIDDHIICREKQFNIFLFNIQTFVSFPFIALARASSSMLKRSGKRSHPFLLPSSFSPVSIISVVGFCQKVFNSSKFPDIPNLLSFFFFLIMNGCWVFSNAFSAPIDMIVCVLLLFLVCWYDGL